MDSEEPSREHPTEQEELQELQDLSKLLLSTDLVSLLDAC